MPTRLPLMPIAGSAGSLRREQIDRWFGWFWRHLRGLGRMFDTVVCANAQLAERLRAGGIGNAETIRMGVEAGPVLAVAALGGAARAGAGGARPGERCDLAARRRPLLGGEALGHGDARGRRSRPQASGRNAARRRRAASRRRLELLAERMPRCRRAAADHRPRASLPGCSPAPTRWCTAARQRPSAWSPPKRARAEFR